MAQVTLSEFLQPFFPDENEDIWILGFPAKKLPDDHPDKGRQYKKKVTRKLLATNQLVQNNLKETNKTLGLYFVVNAGGTLKTEITRVNASFCEFDDLSLEAQHEQYDKCGIIPSIRVHTRKSVHAYWLLEGGTVENWINVQNGIIQRFKSDEVIKNQNRVMRLPHFNHVHWNGSEYEYTRVVIERFSVDRVSLEQMAEHFPYTPPPKPKYEEIGFNNDTWEGVQIELRFRISQLESYRIELNRVWATAKGICHDGNNNTALTVNLRTGAVSCKSGCDYEKILNAFGLSKPVKINTIRRVHAPRQESELYKYLTETV